MQPTNLRLEFLKTPIGLDMKKPRFSWEFTGTGEMQSGYRIIVSSKLDVLNADEGDLWDSGEISSNQMNNIIYCGKPFDSFQKYYWKVKVKNNNDIWSEWSDLTYWITGAMEKSDLKAKWIGDTELPFETIEVIDATKSIPQKIIKSNPSPLLRREFQSKGQVKSAIAMISALGYYEAYINGKKIGDRFLTPEWTDYNKRILYQTFDLTDSLNDKNNVIGAMLADGWFMGLLGPGDAIRQHYYGNKRYLYFQLEIEYESGEKETIKTDESWMLYRDGPIRSADNFIGETYDANKEIPNWNTMSSKELNSEQWAKVEIRPNDSEITQRLCAQINTPIEKIAEFKPTMTNFLTEKKVIIDFGQNLVGVCKFQWDGKMGSKISIRHGEMLEEDGNLHIDNLRLAQQRDDFIHDGSGLKTFQPTFTFHGFQYIEITGDDCKSIVDSITAIAFSSVTDVTGSFVCSDPLLNKLWQNVLWTQRDNMVSIPTDCPQRNERMGWMGDALIFAQTGIYNSDLASFFTKFNYDIIDSQKPDGRIPDIVPHPMGPDKFTNAPGWADCVAEIPWQLYLNYGDTVALEQSLEVINKHLDYVIKTNPNYIWTKCGNKYGDWLNGDNLKLKGYPKKGGKMPFETFSTANLYRTVGMFLKISKILKKEDYIKKYTPILEEIKSTYLKKFVKSNGKIKGDTQASYAISADFGLIPKDLIPKSKDRLKNAIKKYSGRISTGFFSTRTLLAVLRDLGEIEQAYTFIQTKQFPSWGYSIEQGATTIWERWDAYVKGRGFQNKGMNSFNHYAYGSVVEFFYSTILGINPDEKFPGYERMRFSPHFGSTLTHAEGSYRSIRGEFKVNWKRNGLQVECELEVPNNCSVLLDLEKCKHKLVRISGIDDSNNTILQSGTYQMLFK